MGKGSGGGTNTVTSTSQAPQWLQNNLQSLYGQAQNVTSQPLQQYSGQTVAGFTPDQTAAMNTVNATQGQAQPYYNQAQSLINQSSQPITASPINASTIAQYQSPYQQQVINATQAQLNQNDQTQQQQLESGAIQSGASPFGGDRAGVAAAALAGQQDLANNQTIAGLENQNYTQALGEANTQQQAQLNAQEASSYLGQQGAQNLTNLGTTSENTALSGASAQLQSGALQQQLAQENLNVPYEQFVQQQAYPYQQLSALEQAAGLTGGLAGGTSSTTSPSPSTASQIGGLGLTGLGLYGAASSKTGGKIKDFDSGGVALPDVPDLDVSYTGSTQPQVYKSSIPAAPKGSSTTTGGGSFSPGSLGLSAGAMKQVGAGISNLWNGTGSSGGLSGMLGIGSPASNALSGTETMPAGMQGADAAASGSGLLESGGEAGAEDAGAEAMSDDAFSSFLDALPIMFSKKGGVASYADGGLTPFDTSDNPLANNITSRYSQLSPDQLRQLSIRVPANAPQAQIIQKLIQQKSAMPNVTGQQQAAPQQGMTNASAAYPQYSGTRRGGIAGYADGGDPNQDALAVLDPDGGPDNQVRTQDAYSNAQSGLEAADVESQKDQNPVLDHSGDTIKVNYKSTGESLDTGLPSDKSQPQAKQEVKPDKWEALMAAGLGMMGGTSPFAAVNIGRGGLEGLKNYEEQKEDIVKQQQEQNQERQTSQQGQYQQGELGVRKQELAQQATNQQAELGIKQQQLEQGKYTITPDGMGGFLKTNNKTGETDFIKGQGLGTVPPTDSKTGQPLTGDAYLASLPQNIQGTVKAVANGDQQFPTGFALKSPYWQQVLGAVYQYDPTANGQRFGNVQKFEMGPQGNTARALNTSVAHLDTADQLSQALQTGDVKMLNRVSNLWKTETGQEAPTDFNTAKQIVSSEVIKAISNAGAGGVADREYLQKQLDAAGSPAQLSGAIKTAQKLLVGQVDSLKGQYEDSTGRQDFLTKKLTPRSASIYERYNPNGQPADTGTLPAAATQPKVIHFNDLPQ